MPRVCTKCARVVAEAAYCPFCSEPTIEHIPVSVQRSEGNEVRTVLTESQHGNSWLGGVVIISGLILFLGVCLALDFLPIISIACFVPFGAALFFTILYLNQLACRCPRCGKELAHLTGQNIRYCPFCGVDLAVEIYPDRREATEFLKKVSGPPGLEIKNTDIQLPPDKQKASTNIQLPPGKEDK